MTDNDWIKQLQSKMEGHQEPVPDDLWQDIEKRLPGARRPLLPWARRAAAAAVVAAVVGVGSLLWHHGGKDDASTMTLTPTAVATGPEAVQEQLAQVEWGGAQDDESAATAHVSPSVPTAGTGRGVSNQATVDDGRQQAAPGATEATPTNPPIEVTPANPPAETTPANPPAEQARQPMQQRQQGHVKESPTTTVPHQPILPKFKKSGLTVGLYASNSVKSDWLSGRDYAYESDAICLPGGDNPYGTYYSEDIYSANHHAPMSMGLSVRLPLTDRLALTSGLVYTRLKSDFTSSRRHREQTLHYLGVPLGVTYNVWGYKRFSIYAVGGVQADFNVKATLNEDGQANSLSIGKDRVQFSGMLGPGLQLDVTREFGLYVEPTARYYFNNGSNVANYYKDKPWNINFNAGLRLTLK